MVAAAPPAAVIFPQISAHGLAMVTKLLPITLLPITPWVQPYMLWTCLQYVFNALSGILKLGKKRYTRNLSRGKKGTRFAYYIPLV